MAETPRVLFLSSRDTRERHAFETSSAASLRNLGDNSGNLAFTRAVQTYLQAAGTPYDVLRLTTGEGLAEPVDWSRYSACVINVSNWLAPGRVETLRTVARVFGGVKTPTYMIGLGAQAPLGADPSFLDPIAEDAKAFIAAVLDTGGGFALRGAFTGRCFDALGFKDHYTVTGCPSLFQKGEAMRIDEAKVDFEAFKPLANGHRQFHDPGAMRALLQTGGGQFICQDELVKVLRFPQELTSPQRRALLRRSQEALALLAEGRVQVFGNVEDWVGFIREGGFNFAFGSRIHGNVFALLAGVPALIDLVDERTREIAEVFDIPAAPGIAVTDARGLYDRYLATDYGAFNRRFPERLAIFRDFLARHRLPMAVPAPGEIEGRKEALAQPPRTLSTLLRDYIAFRPLPLPGLGKRAQFILYRQMTGRPV